MQSMLTRRPFAAAIVLSILLATLGGCTATDRRDARVQYDLGHPTAAGAAPAPGAEKMPPVAIGEISAPSWMDSSRMVYRLEYDNPLEANTYANARWTMSPSKLLLQRIKSRISEAGGAVLGPGDGGPSVRQLRIEADDFSQVFTAPGVSIARVILRVSVLQDRKLVAQRTFVGSAPAPAPNAAGGAQALARASDILIADMLAWLSALPPRVP